MTRRNRPLLRRRSETRKCQKNGTIPGGPTAIRALPNSKTIVDSTYFRTNCSGKPKTYSSSTVRFPSTDFRKRLLRCRTYLTMCCSQLAGIRRVRAKNYRFSRDGTNNFDYSVDVVATTTFDVNKRVTTHHPVPEANGTRCFYEFPVSFTRLFISGVAKHDVRIQFLITFVTTSV